MNLCIDEGNTALKYGVFNGNQIVGQGNDLDSLNAAEVKRVIISTVLHDAKAVSWCRDHNLTFHLLSFKLKLPFSISYQTPETLGADRIAAVSGALLQNNMQNNLVIVAGTCITYNFIDNNNSFRGGSISPGIRMRFKALNHFTAALPLIEWNGESQSEITGTDTNTSIISGVLHGTIEEVRGVINSYKSRFNDLNIIISGGDSAFLVSQLKNDIFARPELLLEGLNYILSYNED